MRAERRIAGYLFAVAMVAVAYGLRLLLEPLTGFAAPFVLLFAAVMVTSLYAGTGPGVLTSVLGTLLGTVTFVMRTGFDPSQAAFQGALFAVDSGVVIYLCSLSTRARRIACASEAKLRELIELAPDAFFLANLDARFVDANQAAVRLLGYTREELLGMRVFDLVAAEDVARLEATRASLLVPGRTEKAEWRLRHKDGVFRPCEVSANILPDGRWQAFVRDISERKRREDERQVFASLLDNSSDFIGIADPGGNPLYLNPAGRRMVGLPADYPLEQTQILDYYAVEQREHASKVILKAMQEHGRWSGETAFRHFQTGESIPVSNDQFMIRDPESGRVLGMGAVTRDISGARRANTALRESEERFRLALEEAPIGMALVALDGRFTRVNTALCDISGYPACELERLRIQDITHPDDRHTDLALAARLARGTIPRCQHEKRYVRKNGTIVTLALSASILRAASGEPLCYIVQIEDISGRKQLENEQHFLAEAGEVLASSLDYEQTLATVCQLVVRDLADVCIVDVVEHDQRPRRLKVMGADPAMESVVAGLENLHLDRSQPHLLSTVLETQRPFLIEHVTPDDIESLAQSEVHARLLRQMDARSLMGVPLLLHGRLLGALLLVSSTPGRVYGPADLRLAQALADRAALAIDNGLLYQTAKQVTERRDQMLGVVAHDLRNPLAIILMNTSLLQRSGPEPERRNQKPKESIQRAAKRMNRLIQDLLDVTRIEARQLGVERERVSTRQLLAESLETQRPLAQAASIELRLELGKELPDVWGDSDRLLQVLENLLGNSLKFTTSGGAITVGASAGEHEVLFWVSDTGCGISPAGLKRVFDHFWQAKKGTRKGAGLGLPIARGIVEAHGGQMWVDSAPGRGSTFYFTIPRAGSPEVPRPELTGSPTVH